MDTKITGNLIKEKRKVKNLTQLQLAERLNISNRAISKWENGDGFPDITLLPDLAKELDITIDELLTGVKPEKEIEYITVEPEIEKVNINKLKSKLLISEIIAFCLCFGATIIGGATEVLFFHKPMFYAFIEIYLLVATLALLIVSVIVMLTGLVRHYTEAQRVEPKQYIITYLFFVLASVAPACLMFRGLTAVFFYNLTKALLLRYIFSGTYIVAIILGAVFVAKKYKETKNEKGENDKQNDEAV